MSLRLTIDFTAERVSDGTSEIDIQELSLNDRPLPFAKVQLDAQVIRPCQAMLDRVLALLPKEWWK